MIKPISPEDAGKDKKFPDEVIEAFNETIAKHFYNDVACFTQDEVEKLIVRKGIKANEIYRNHWMDVEETYRNAGWIVEYEKSGYNETSPDTFTFKRKIGKNQT